MASTGGGNTPRKRKRCDDRLLWTLPIEEVLLNSLVTAVEIGHRAENGFKKTAWNLAQKALCKEFPEMLFRMRVCQSKIDDLKKYRVFQSLCDNNGFGWDAVKKIPTAPDHVWVEYFTVKIILSNYLLI
jgi:hypothetical protein